MRHVRLSTGLSALALMAAVLGFWFLTPPKVTQESLVQLRRGMTEKEVKRLLGSPAYTVRIPYHERTIKNEDIGSVQHWRLENLSIVPDSVTQVRIEFDNAGQILRVDTSIHPKPQLLPW